MRYIYFKGGNEYCGCGFDEVHVFPDDTTDAFLNDLADDMAYNNGQDYEYMVTGWEEDFETEEDYKSYYENCWCTWREISKEAFEEMGGKE